MKSDDRNSSRRWTRLMLLAMLAERDGYGYDLAQRMKSPETPSLSDPAEENSRDISPIYRILKELESQGCIEGKRERRTDGRPERRRLRITAVGRQALAEGVTAVREYRKRLDLFASWVGAVAKSSVVRSVDGVEDTAERTADDSEENGVEENGAEDAADREEKTPEVARFRRHFVDFD